MFVLILIVFAPFALAAVAAIGFRFLAMRTLPPLDIRLTILTLLAGGIPFLIVLTVQGAGFWFPAAVNMDMRVRAALPLALGIVAVLLLMVPGTTRRTTATAQVSRRTVMSFLSLRWVSISICLVAVILVLSIAAGRASLPDAEGRFLNYWIHVGTTGTGMGTEIYGWYYSTPSLVGLAALLVTASIAWILVPRPAWNDDPAQDSAVRRLRASNVGRVTCGALLVHLSAILYSLHGTASLSGTVSTTELGVVSTAPPFAALAPALFASGACALALGLTLWVVAGLTAIPMRLRRASPVRST